MVGRSVLFRIMATAGVAQISCRPPATLDRSSGLYDGETSVFGRESGCPAPKTVVEARGMGSQRVVRVEGCARSMLFARTSADFFTVDEDTSWVPGSFRLGAGACGALEIALANYGFVVVRGRPGAE